MNTPNQNHKKQNKNKKQNHRNLATFSPSHHTPNDTSCYILPSSTTTIPFPSISVDDGESCSSSLYLFMHFTCLYSLLHDIHRRSPLRRYLRHISTALPSRLNFSTRFSHIIPKAIATSSLQYSQDAIGAHDDVAEKIGFEKVSEQFIEECKSTAVLYRHKKTGCEVMSVLNDDVT